MRVLICDPSFNWAGGHHLSLNRALVAAFRRAGVETHLLAHRALDPALVAALGATPFFETHPATGHSTDPLCDWLEDWFWNAEMLSGSLARFPVRPDDVMLWHSTCSRQLLAVAGFLAALPPAARPVTVMLFGSNSGITADGPSRVSVMLRFAVRRLPADAPVLFAAQDTAPARSAGVALDRSVMVFPCPYDGEVRLRTACRRIGFLGHQRVEKGIDHLVALTQGLRAADRDLDVVVHDSGPDLEQSGAAARLRALGAVVETGSVTPDRWRELLNSCDILMAPYDPASGAANHSAIVTEAVAWAIPAVVPGNTGVADFMAQWGGGYESFTGWTAPAILGAIDRLRAGFPLQARHSLAAAERWRDTQGTDRFAQTVLDRAAAIARPG
ncbi:MAG: glycosyltransferase [Acidobacteriaceae bacterium]|nr:glycosyltransferase [Acidobacteriaceae bacterium]